MHFEGKKKKKKKIICHLKYTEVLSETEHAFKRSLSLL